MMHRRLWCLAVLLFASTISADEIQCPCVPQDVCSRSADTQSEENNYIPCEDPTTVRCCSGSLPPDSRSEPLEMITKDLEQEEQLMAAIESLMEEMQQMANAEGENREDKSLDGTSKNTFDCDSKQCETKSRGETPNQSSQGNLETLTNESEDLSDSLSLESDHSNSTREERDEGKARNEIVIVYAEKPNKNNTYEEKYPHIVYPSKEALEEYLEGEESLIKEQKLVGKGKKQENESEDEQESEPFKYQQSNIGRSNLHKLFPKRNPALKSSQLQTKPEDLGEAGSEIEEVKTSIPTNVQTEQTLGHKPFRPLPRLLTRRPVTTDEPTQTSSAFESQRGAKGKVSQPTPIHIDTVKTLQSQDPTAAIMDEINLKAVNDMMKTNFTTRSSFLRRRPNMWHPQIRLHMTSDETTGLPTGRTQSEKKRLPRPTISQTGGLATLPDQTQVKTAENTESVEHVTSTTAAEVRGSRYISGRKNQFRSPNANQPTKFSSAVSMSQEQVFDTLKESKLQDIATRRQSYRRLQVKSQSGTPNGDLADQISATQSESSFGKRRSRFRPRSRFENTPPPKPVSNDEPTENTRTAQKSEPTINNPNSPVVNQKFNSGHIASTSPAQVPQESDDEIPEGDLESSGSDIQPQRVPVRGRFSPPQRMEKGFQPMFGPAELNVVGPLPAGFQDRARGFSNQELGLQLQLPRPNFQSQFTETDQFRFDSEEETEKPLRLLPPVILPVTQAPTSPGISSTPSASSNTFSDDDLLPPLQSPMPLSPSSETPKAVEKMMLDQHRDITELNLEFNQLKTRYDMLLNRYAETLKIYNDKYRNLLGSTEENKK